MKIFYAFFIALSLSHLSYSQGCIPADKPDILYQDLNGDGIDGDKTHAIFVDATSGNDVNSGTILLPVQTIEQGITLAAAANKDVYVSKGAYSINTSLQLQPGVNLYGQFSGSPLWSRSAADSTVIMGPTTAVLAENISAETHIEGFQIRSAPATAAGESSYAVRVNNCPALVIIRFNELLPGSGADGTAGVNGNDGGNGGSGAGGSGGSCDGVGFRTGGAPGTSLCGRSGGAGGTGGAEGANNGAAGGTGVGGTVGGNGGVGGDPAGNGASGVSGSDGANGANGTGATTIGTVSGIGFYEPADGSDGTAGAHGNGGGGGGGGGGQGGFFVDDGAGNGGGGGGGGGCAATAGTKGTGGGGSFGVFVVNSSVMIDRNIIYSAAGGHGGNGSNGANGGTGGNGGLGAIICPGEVGVGGNGGAGGNGGEAGSGSGGNGGPSIGIFVDPASNVQADSNYVITGAGGVGGSGGTIAILGQAPNGPMGMSATVYGNIIGIVMDTPTICILDTNIQEPVSGIAIANFTVALSSAARQTITVLCTTANGTASSVSGDFSGGASTLTFLKDEIVKQVSIIVNSDVLPEPTEDFSLNLSAPVGATIADGSGVCTIFDLPVGINDLMAESSDYELKQNIPNPVRDQTDIYFHLPGETTISLQLFDLAGKLVNIIAEGNFNSGWNKATLNCTNLESGIYLYHLKTSNTTLVRKLTVAK